MRKTLSMLVAVGALAAAAAVPNTAAASHCDSRTIVFNYIHRFSPAIDVNITGCSLNPDDEIDLRLIYPGAIAIQVRYIGNFAGVNELTTTLDGIGFASRTIKLTKFVDPELGGVTYDSEQITLPQGRASSGTLRVTTVLPDATTDTTCYYTVDSSCA